MTGPAATSHEELHPDLTGVQPDTWDPDVDTDLGDSALLDPSLYLKLEGFEPLAAARHPNPSDLSDEHRVQARDLAVKAALLGYRSRDQIHYSQNAGLRWTGIRNDLKAYRGEFPSNADCSSFATWCLWNGLDHFSRPGHPKADTVNGLRWLAGYTGTILTHGAQATATLQRGDLIVYGRGWPGLHVTIHVGGGMCISHGSERGPLYLPVHYRPDVMAVRRSI